MTRTCVVVPRTSVEQVRMPGSTFTWRFRNFAAAADVVGGVYSPRFRRHPSVAATWRLNIENGTNASGSVWLELRKSLDDVDIAAAYSLRLLHPSGDASKTIEEEDASRTDTFSVGEGRGYPKFASLKDLSDGGYLDGDALTVQVEFHYADDGPWTPLSTVALPVNSAAGELGRQMFAMLPDLADVVLRVEAVAEAAAGGSTTKQQQQKAGPSSSSAPPPLAAAAATIPCHRAVLAAVSKPLRTMLSGGGAWREGQQREVVLRGVQLESLQALVRWAYGQEVSCSSLELVQLWALADQYDVAGLASACLDALVANATLSPCDIGQELLLEAKRVAPNSSLYTALLGIIAADPDAVRQLSQSAEARAVMTMDDAFGIIEALAERASKRQRRG